MPPTQEDMKVMEGIYEWALHRGDLSAAEEVQDSCSEATLSKPDIKAALLLAKLDTLPARQPEGKATYKEAVEWLEAVGGILNLTSTDAGHAVLGLAIRSEVRR
jgi:hypothetical protein